MIPCTTHQHDHTCQFEHPTDPKHEHVEAVVKHPVRSMYYLSCRVRGHYYITTTMLCKRFVMKEYMPRIAIRKGRSKQGSILNELLDNGSDRRRSLACFQTFFVTCSPTLLICTLRCLAEGMPNEELKELAQKRVTFMYTFGMMNVSSAPPC